MSGWLQGKRVLVLGTGEAAEIVAAAVAASGAECRRAEAWDDTVNRPDDDALVHAGVASRWRAAVDTDLAAWRASQSANLDSRFLATAAFFRNCAAAKRPGSVLMLAAAEGDAARATANGALDNLVKSLAVEWARDGVRTNAIMSRQIGQDNSVADGARAALGNLAVWLLSDFAGYVNGTVTGIDETSRGRQ